MSSKLYFRHLYYSKKKKKKQSYQCWHTQPQFWNQPFLSWFLLAKKVLKSQGLGEGDLRAQPSIIKWVSYGDVMCSLLTLVNPTVLNIWKLIRDLNISYNKKKIVIVYVTPNPKIRGLKCYQCAIASRASQSTELGTVCMYVSECVNRYLIIPPYLYIFKM